MQELFFTILIIWVLFRIFGGQSRVYHTFNYNAQRGGPQQEKTKEGVRIEEKEKSKPGKSDNGAGEYVDFEEIKD